MYAAHLLVSIPHNLKYQLFNFLEKKTYFLQVVIIDNRWPMFDLFILFNAASQNLFMIRYLWKGYRHMAYFSEDIFHVTNNRNTYLEIL